MKMFETADERRSKKGMGSFEIVSSFVLLAILGVPAHASGIEVVDDAGHRIVLEKPARRIVGLAPHATEILFAAGAGPYLIGAVSYSDYPEAAKRIPRLGGYDNPDLERIVALKPDLVVAWQSGNPPAPLERLRAPGLIVYVSEPRKIEDIPRHVEQLGRLAGTDALARRATHNALRSACSTRSGTAHS